MHFTVHELKLLRTLNKQEGKITNMKVDINGTKGTLNKTKIHET